MTDEKVNPLGMKSLKESLSVPLGKTIGDYFKRIITYDWIFGSWYEKLILIAMMIWSLFSLYKFVSGLF